MLKRLGHSIIVQRFAAIIAYAYCRLVLRTTRYTMVPEDFVSTTAPEQIPAIFALWHGQHLMAHAAWPPAIPVAALISRNKDAEINALVLQKLGVKAIRGSGGRPGKMHQRGGVSALREMLRALESGRSLVLTADVPKTARRCGEGIVTLSKLSGRPVFPLAVINKWRINFNSWDRACLALPFGKGIIMFGEPVDLPANASKDDVEGARAQLESSLNAIHARAYAMLNSKDPGAILNSRAFANEVESGSH